MADTDTDTGTTPTPRRTRYEFRVWGEHRKACKLLSRIGTDETRESIEDCYLIVDDPSYNAKVRDNTLKVKRLLAEAKGFERWGSNRHRTPESAPSPFDLLFDELRLDRPQRGKSYDLVAEVSKLDPELEVTPVFVTKRRRRYRIGEMRAEVTDIVLTDSDQTLHTLSIEGDDLQELVSLRKRLGLKSEPNVAVHQAIAAAA